MWSEERGQGGAGFMLQVCLHSELRSGSPGRTGPGFYRAPRRDLTGFGHHIIPHARSRLNPCTTTTNRQSSTSLISHDGLYTTWFYALQRLLLSAPTAALIFCQHKVSTHFLWLSDSLLCPRAGAIPWLCSVQAPFSQSRSVRHSRSTRGTWKRNTAAE